MSQRRPRTPKLRSALTLILAGALLSAVAAAGALAQGGKSSLIGKLEGPEVVTDSAKWPKAFKEAPQLAELVKAGKLPPVAERIGQDPLVIKPLKEVGKYGGTWRAGFTGPADFWNGFRCCSGPGPSHVLGLHGRQGHAEPRQGPRDAGRRPRVARAPAPRDEVERRQAVHRRRLRLLVRGHLSEQGSRADAVGDPGHQWEAGRDREGRHLHGALQVRRAVLHVPRRAGRLHRARGPDVGVSRAGRLRAGALPEAVPPEVRGRRPSSTRRRRTRSSTAGCAYSSTGTTGRSIRISRCCRRGRR